MRAILRREFAGYFDSLMGFGVIGAFVVLMTLLSLLLDPLGGGGDWFKRGELTMRTFFAVFPWAAAVIVPAISMRLWSEDRRQATFELLMTLPIPSWKVAVGKYLAGVCFLAVMLAATIAYPIMLASWGEPDWGPVFGGYFACFVLGSAFVAIGMFASGLTDNQALAFFLGMLFCLGIVGVGELSGLLGGLARTHPTAALLHLVSIPVVGIGLLAAAVGRDKLVAGVVGGAALLANGFVYLVTDDARAQADAGVPVTTQAGETVIAAISQINVLEHFREIQRGVVNSNGLIFFASYVALFLMLNIWSLESRRFG
ncbi:MAG: ABC transporter permease [Nitrospira sp.]|nr:ABC transporter permease [Nitrospira sp.]